MKKAYIIHRWSGSSSSDWYDWLRKELIKRGFRVIVFDMPNTEEPKIEEWVGFLREKIQKSQIDEETYFIGHSVGCQTIMRFLEKLHKHKKIGGCVFVAPWLDLIGLEPEELKIAHPWTNTKIDFSRILDHCSKFFCIFSENDPYVHVDEAKKFKENLGARVIFKKEQGHFTEEDKVKTIPEILEFLR